MRPELVVEITYLTLTVDGLVRQAVYQGLREDKRARDVRLKVRDFLDTMCCRPELLSERPIKARDWHEKASRLSHSVLS